MKASEGQLRQALDRPSDSVRLFLLHGPDEAGAHELSQRLARAMGPEAERVDLDGAMLRSNPGRLMEEAASLSLFGGARYIRVTGVGEESLAAVEQLLAADRAGNPVVMIAPGLKTTSKLVKFAVAAPAVLVTGCYVPEGEGAVRLAEQIARDAGLRLQSAAARALATATAGDRAVMAREIEKLALYLDASPDQPKDADLAALEAIAADLGESQISSVTNALIAGEARTAVAELAAYQAEGGNMIALIRAVQRRLLQLAELQAEVDGGMSPHQAVEQAHIFKREQPAMIRALERWPARRIAMALDRTVQTERTLKRAANAGDVIGSTLLAGLARAAGGTRAR